MEKWEYVSTRNSEQLNDLGAAGWELVSVVPVREEPVFYFKRRTPSFVERITLEQRAQFVEEAER